MILCIYDVALRVGTRAFTKSLNHHLNRTFSAPIETPQKHRNDLLLCGHQYKFKIFRNLKYLCFKVLPCGKKWVHRGTLIRIFPGEDAALRSFSTNGISMTLKSLDSYCVCFTFPNWVLIHGYSRQLVGCSRRGLDNLLSPHIAVLKG